MLLGTEWNCLIICTAAMLAPRDLLFVSLVLAGCGQVAGHCDCDPYPYGDPCSCLRVSYSTPFASHYTNILFAVRLLCKGIPIHQYAIRRLLTMPTRLATEPFFWNGCRGLYERRRANRWVSLQPCLEILINFEFRIRLLYGTQYVSRTFLLVERT